MNTFNALLILAFTALATSAATPASSNLRAKEICGDLGVLDITISSLHKGVKPSDLRMCADHPLGRNRTVDPAEGASLAPFEGKPLDAADPNSTPAARGNVFEERACYKGAPYGCSGGFCWKACGDKDKGEWCWTALAWGAGNWRTCNTWQDCGTLDATYGCGKGCVVPYVCGCSC